LTQRTELLMGLFFLLTLYSAIRAASSRHPWRWWAAAIAACALGMGAKEVMAAAPIIVLLYDRSFLSGSFREALRRRWPLYLGLAATWAILGALLIAYPWGAATGAGFGLPEAGPWEYARTQPGVILNYLKLSFWPKPLCLDYGWPIATSARQIVPAGAVIAALLAATFWALRRAPALGFLGAWFFLILAPTSSFVPIVTEVAAERRMYLPLAAIVTAGVIGAYWLGKRLLRSMIASPETRKLTGRAVAAAAGLSFAGLLGCVTFDRNADYRTAISIWQDTVNKRPENPRALYNLGWYLGDAGDYPGALNYLNRAIELRPEYADARNNRADVYIATGRFQLAVDDCDYAMGLEPYNPQPYNNRGLALAGLRRYEEALRDYDRALALRPRYGKAYNGRANVYIALNRFQLAMDDCDHAIRLEPYNARPYNNRGLAFAGLHRYEEALRAYDQAIRLEPHDPLPHINRGLALASLHRYEEALRDYDQALALNRNLYETYFNRALALVALGRDELALRDYSQSIALKPQFAEGYRGRALVYAKMSRRAEALKDLDTAVALSPDSPLAYYSRALLYFEMKDYNRARADMEACEKLHGEVAPEFRRAVMQATARTSRTKDQTGAPHQEGSVAPPKGGENR